MADEKRLIDANSIIKRLEAMKYNTDAITIDGIIRALKEPSTVDAVGVVHGRWRRFINGDGEYKYLCNVCERVVSYEMGGSNYCPNCGAKMDGGNGDG